ncbi:MAG: exosortase O [Cyanobacteria bacterium J06642_2]
MVKPAVPARALGSDTVNTATIAIAWLAVNADSLRWLGASLQDASHLHLALLGALVVGLGVRGWQSRWQMTGLPHWRWLPCCVVALGAIFSTLVRVGFGHGALSFCGFAIATYGLLGLFLAPRGWRQGIPAALVVVGLLPVSIQFGSGMGFSLRVLTAGVVEQVLTAAGVAAISAHDVILLENSIAHVDLPCSGLKSVAVGLLFWAGCSWLEGRKVGGRWLGTSIFCVFAMIAANVARVLALVLLGDVWQRRWLADLVHVPLGIIGFAIACALTWLLLQTVPKYTSETSTLETSDVAREELPMSALARWGLVAAIAAMAALPGAPPPITGVADVSWPRAFQLETLDLNSAERQFFARDPLASSHKYRFEWHDASGRTLKGSLLTVASPSWRSHHAPELCYVGNGLQVDRMQSVDVESGMTTGLTPIATGAAPFPVRWLSLAGDSRSALYWFQSATSVTDNLLSRIGAAIAMRDRAWVMVSVLFEQSHAPSDASVREFARQTRAAITRSFTGDVR